MREFSCVFPIPMKLIPTFQHPDVKSGLIPATLTRDWNVKRNTGNRSILQHLTGKSGIFRGATGDRVNDGKEKGAGAGASVCPASPEPPRD